MLIKVAGLIVAVENACGGLTDRCRDYTVSGGLPDLTVSLTEAGYASQLIELSRAVSAEMPRHGGFLLHASALSYKGNGILFTALSGTGKSTHSSMWRKAFGEDVVMINDDKPMLRFRDDGLFVCGTPWSGKHRLDTNAEVPLRAIVFLARGEKNTLSPAAPGDILPLIFDQIPRLLPPKAMELTLSLLDRVLTLTPLFRLYCTPDEDAARTALCGLKGVLL